MPGEASDPPTEPRVVVEMSLSDAAVLQEALDFYQRIGMGQFEEIKHLFSVRTPTAQVGTATPEPWDFDPDTVHALSWALARALMGPHARHGASFGIRSRYISNAFRVAYDIQQVVRSAVARHRHPEGGWTVDFDRFHKTSESDSTPPKAVVVTDPR